MTVVDLVNRAAPRILQRVSIGRHAHTLSLSPDGQLLAINTDEPGRTLILREVRPTGEIGRELAAVGVDVAGKPIRRVGRVEWHPSGRFLANGLPFQDEIRFFQVNRSGGAVDLSPWGAPVKVGKFPDEGAFTPDGRFYLSTDLNWGDDVPGFFVEAPPGTITAVAFDAEQGQHRVTGRAPTDISPEGIAISPDGRFVVTGNLTRSYLPWTDARLLDEGSLDLLELDPGTGELHARHRIPIHGILPEGLAFDTSGHYVAATVYDRFDPRRRAPRTMAVTEDLVNIDSAGVDRPPPSGEISMSLEQRHSRDRLQTALIVMRSRNHRSPSLLCPLEIRESNERHGLTHRPPR